MIRRASGILLHITSLPCRYGVGDMGPSAYRFVDFLAKASQRYWQVLPLNPPAQDRGSYSPYNGGSAFAGNPLLISPEQLFREGLLCRADLADVPGATPGKVKYRLAWRIKSCMLQAAYERFKQVGDRKDFLQFCQGHRDWLDDFALFVTLQKHFRNRPWHTWPTALRDRQPEAMAEAKRTFSEAIEQERFQQYVFFRQWLGLRRYCSRRGVAVIGDVPMYVAYESADVWANPHLFELTKAKRPCLVAGVPPDAFSRTGQLWGNPVYNWTACRKQRFAWWVQRIRHNLAMFDIVRLDHFRGFAGFWAVSAGHRTAARGRWRKGPGHDLIDRVLVEFPARRFMAEDLGHITRDVTSLIERYGLTSTRVLQFAFDGRPAANAHYPHNCGPRCVMYTGTHDTTTTVGWFGCELDVLRKRVLAQYLGHRVTTGTVHEDLIRLALGSPAALAIIPMQDVLGLGPEARMNRPGTSRGNWTWQLRAGQLNSRMAERLASWTEVFGRC